MRTGGRVPILFSICTFLIVQSFIFSILPVKTAISHGSPSLGTTVILVMSLGMLGGDLLIRRISKVFGANTAVFIGIPATGGGSVLTLLSASQTLAVVGAAVTGVGLATTSTPLLATFAVLARDRQLFFQGINAITQRGGALLSGLLVGASLGEGAVISPAPAIILLLILTSAGVLLVTRRGATGEGSRAKAPEGTTQIVSWRALLRGREARIGALVAASVIFLTVAGGSVLPLAFAEAGAISHVPITLVIREVWAVLGVALLLGFARGRGVELWVGSVAVAVLGFGAAAISAGPAMIVLGSSLHGAAIGIGIVVANVMIYNASHRSSVVAGFSLNGVASRISSIATPAIFAWFTVTTFSLSMVSGAVCVLIIGAVLSQRRTR